MSDLSIPVSLAVVISGAIAFFDFLHTDGLHWWLATCSKELILCAPIAIALFCCLAYIYPCQYKEDFDEKLDPDHPGTNNWRIK